MKNRIGIILIMTKYKSETFLISWFPVNYSNKYEHLYNINSLVIKLSDKCMEVY